MGRKRGTSKGYDPKYAPKNYNAEPKVNQGLRDTKWDLVQARLRDIRENVPGERDEMYQELSRVRTGWPDFFQSTGVSNLLWSARFVVAHERKKREDEEVGW